MKSLSREKTVRLNCGIRPDIKAALTELAAKQRAIEGGGYVGLTRVINEASLMLLRREGVELKEPRPVRPPAAKPVKTLVRRKQATGEMAVQA